jgi:hypothetical protein
MVMRSYDHLIHIAGMATTLAIRIIDCGLLETLGGDLAGQNRIERSTIRVTSFD